MTYEEPGSRRPRWLVPAVAVVALLVAVAALAFFLTRGDDESALAGEEISATPSPTPSPTATPTPEEEESPAPEPEETPTEPAEPDYSAVDYPIDCPAEQIVLRDSDDTVDFTGDGRAEAVRLVVCETGAGNPSSVLVVFTAADDGTPELLDTLLSEADDELVTEIEVTADAVRATGEAYSSEDVPRCCPDVQVDERWQWDGSGFARS